MSQGTTDYRCAKVINENFFINQYDAMDIAIHVLFHCPINIYWHWSSQAV